MDKRKFILSFPVGGERWGDLEWIRMMEYYRYSMYDNLVFCSRAVVRHIAVKDYKI